MILVSLWAILLSIPLRTSLNAGQVIYLHLWKHDLIIRASFLWLSSALIRTLERIRGLALLLYPMTPWELYLAL